MFGLNFLSLRSTLLLESHLSSRLPRPHLLAAYLRPSSSVCSARPSHASFSSSSSSSSSQCTLAQTSLPSSSDSSKPQTSSPSSTSEPLLTDSHSSPLPFRDSRQKKQALLLAKASRTRRREQYEQMRDLFVHYYYPTEELKPNAYKRASPSLTTLTTFRLNAVDSKFGEFVHSLLKDTFSPSQPFSPSELVHLWEEHLELDIHDPSPFRFHLLKQISANISSLSVTELTKVIGGVHRYRGMDKQHPDLFNKVFSIFIEKFPSLPHEDMVAVSSSVLFLFKACPTLSLPPALLAQIQEASPRLPFRMHLLLCEYLMRRGEMTEVDMLRLKARFPSSLTCLNTSIIFELVSFLSRCPESARDQPLLSFFLSFIEESMPTLQMINYPTHTSIIHFLAEIRYLPKSLLCQLMMLIDPRMEELPLSVLAALASDLACLNIADAEFQLRLARRCHTSPPQKLSDCRFYVTILSKLAMVNLFDSLLLSYLNTVVARQDLLPPPESPQRHQLLLDLHIILSSLAVHDKSAHQLLHSRLDPVLAETLQKESLSIQRSQARSSEFKTQVYTLLQEVLQGASTSSSPVHSRLDIDYCCPVFPFALDITLTDLKVAVETDTSDCFTLPLNYPTGITALRRRLIQAQGWRLFSIPEQTWMSLSDDQAKKKLLSDILEFALSDRAGSGQRRSSTATSSSSLSSSPFILSPSKPSPAV